MAAERIITGKTNRTQCFLKVLDDLLKKTSRSKKSICFKNFKKIRRFFKLISTSSIDPDEQYSRLKLMERDLGVPIKIFVLAITAYFLFFTDEFKGTQWLDVALEPVQQFFMGYVLINVGAIAFLLFFNRWPLRVVHWVTLVMNFVDAMVVSALVAMSPTPATAAATPRSMRQRAVVGTTVIIITVTVTVTVTVIIITTTITTTITITILKSNRSTLIHTASVATMATTSTTASTAG